MTGKTIGAITIALGITPDIREIHSVEGQWKDGDRRAGMARRAIGIFGINPDSHVIHSVELDVGVSANAGFISPAGRPQVGCGQIEASRLRLASPAELSDPRNRFCARCD